MQFVNRELVRSGFVRALRVAFEANADFRYLSSPTDPNQPRDDSSIFIYDAWPWKRINYPAIVITLGPGDPFMRTLGGEHRSDNVTEFANAQDGLTYSNVDSEVYGGGVETSVNITVYARSSIQRSQIMDWTAIYIRHYFVSAFEKQGVTFVNMSHGGERIEMVGTDPVYVDTLTALVYSEFEHTISTELAGTIDAVSLTNLFTLLPDGVTVTS